MMKSEKNIQMRNIINFHKASSMTQLFVDREKLTPSRMIQNLLISKLIKIFKSMAYFCAIKGHKNDRLLGLEWRVAA